MSGPPRCKRDDEIVAEGGNRADVQPGISDFLPIQKMFGRKVPHRQIRYVSPAVRLTRKKSDSLGRRRITHKIREILRQRGQCHLVDETMSGIVPRVKRVHRNRTE